MKKLHIPSLTAWALSRRSWQLRYGRRFATRHRIGGAKGVVVIDPTLKDECIYIRPSMSKFESDSLEIEIARAFNHPAPMYLNRSVIRTSFPFFPADICTEFSPLVMLLDGLGVKSDVFLQIQEDAIREAKASIESMATCAKFMRMYGLGSHFDLPFLMEKLDAISINSDPFIRRLVEATYYSVMRDFKQRARIPVPQSWTLVGVADEWEMLGPNEIYGESLTWPLTS
jgi:RNA-dependent RNA polymerase